MINILLVEDHHVMRKGLRMLLESDEEINITAEAENGQQALDILMLNSHVDVILTDLNMPIIGGIALAQALTDSGSAIKVIILSMHDKETYIFKAIKAGAAAYLLKSINPVELLFAIKHVYGGERYICSSLAMDMLDKKTTKFLNEMATEHSSLELSIREAEVLQLLAEGVTNQGMSEKLFLSKRTVEGYRQSLIEKFRVSNTAELICAAMRSGQIS